MTAAAAAAAALFFVLWWMLQAEESPWVPAGLAASVVMLVAGFARLLVARRVRNQRWQPNHESHEHAARRPTLTQVMHSTSRHAAALRALQRQSAAADEKDSADLHRELYELCSEYLSGADKALQSPALQADGRVALRAGQERVREMQRHHLLTWARSSARLLTHEAQQRVRLYEKVETANRALDCIDQALRVYPDERDLRTSAEAVQEFITSSRVAHWVELAERAAFKGYLHRAIDCYRDALYYLGRDKYDSAGDETAERILKEIDILRARLSAEAITPGGGRSELRPDHRSESEIH
jgi:tetratricopeptide (TPR) repeat protein